MESIMKRDLIEVIDKSTKELHQQIDMHRYLMAAILDRKVSEDTLNKLHLPASRCELRLKEAIKETIDVLEETKKAFKSKKLEVLRKKLTSVLIESE
jgi:hypothetical protein